MAVSYDTKKGIVKLAAAADEITGEKPVQFIYAYMKGATVGDDVKVTDTAGNTIYEDAATEANYTRIFPVNRRVIGVKLATMDTSGGYVLVIMDKTYALFAS